MRRRWLVVALALGVSAHAGKKNKNTAPPQGTADAPSWAPQKDPNADVDPCPTTPPPGYRLEIGYAQSKVMAEAMDEAREKARERLVEKACAGISQLRCERIKRHISPWEGGLYDAKQKSACAAMAIKKGALGEFEADMDKLEDNLATFAASATDAADGKEVTLAPPTWASGCVAAGMGASVAGRVRNAMVEAGANVRAAGTKEAGRVLRITMAPSRDVVTLSAAFRDGQSLAGFEFRSDLFSIDEDEVGECAPDKGLGLQDGEKIGADGLRVQVSMPTSDGMVCEGEKTDATITVSKAADVQLFSVARDGTAYLVWPPPPELGISGAIDDELKLGPLELIKPNGFSGDESLVAVAVPRGGDLGPTAGLTGFCKLDGPFGPLTYHREAAVGRMTYSVVPDGTRGCVKRVSAEQRTQLEQQLRTAPICR